MRWLLFVLVVVALSAILSRIGAYYGNDGGESRILRFGDTEVNIEIADTDGERVTGLSGRTNLRAQSGLLFAFEKSGYFGIWMKDMNFPIDIAWLDKDKKVVHMEERVSPQTYPKIFYPKSESLYVLETNAGFLEKAGVKIGDQAEF